MKNAGIDGSKMNYTLHFDKPFKADATGFYNVATEGNGTKVTWNYYQKFNFVMSAMQAFMSMDKMLGSQFDSGLNNLKKYVESKPSAAGSGGMVTETQFPGNTYAGIRKTIAMKDLQKAYMDTYTMLGKELGPKIAGPASDLVYSWDTAKHVTDMAIVFPIKDTTNISKKVTIFHVNPGKADMGVLKGGYSGMMAIHGAINKYMAEKGHKMGMVVEEYTVGDHDTKDSTKWVTNIYYITQ